MKEFVELAFLPMKAIFIMAHNIYYVNKSKYTSFTF
jgi:hypothetical protein